MRRIIKYLSVNQLMEDIAAMNGCMSVKKFIVTTIIAGVGENQEDVRWDSCQGLEFLGVKMDKEANHCRGVERVISAPDSKVKVCLIPTDEEIVIARDTMELVAKK